jgi:hypothetical protein
VRAFTNPGNVGHGFFKARFVDPCPRGLKILRDPITLLKRIYVPFLGIDNPHLQKNDPGYLKRLEGLEETERKAKLYGDWNSYEGQVFTEFRAMHLPGEPENALHVIAPFEIPEWWPRFLVIDWGFAAKTFAIWSAISPDGRVYIYRTYAWQRTLVKVWSREAVILSGTENYEDFVLCHSASQKHGQDQTIKQQVSEAFDDRYAIRDADRDRIGGKNLIHEFLRFTQRPKFKQSRENYDHELSLKILRLKGEDDYNQYLLTFVPEPDEMNLPKLQIFTHGPEGRENKELIDVIPACVPNEHNPEDVAEFKGDDPYDALRMVVKTATRYFDLAGETSNRLNRIQALVDKFKNTHNATAYHHEMEKLEAELSSGNSVRRLRAIGRRR